jgi:hypothetical protein
MQNAQLVIMTQMWEPHFFSALLCLVRSSRIPATLHIGKTKFAKCRILITLHILTAASIYLASG